MYITGIGRTKFGVLDTPMSKLVHDRWRYTA